jgi:hypothetical protein
MWKAAEVSQAGGKVSHIPHRWPPELKINMPSLRSAQSWFIPKDFRYDVDWENSMGPWRPMIGMKDFAYLSSGSGVASFSTIWTE